jgi:hypothetical protein
MLKIIIKYLFIFFTSDDNYLFNLTNVFRKLFVSILNEIAK